MGYVANVQWCAFPGGMRRARLARSMIQKKIAKHRSKSKSKSPKKAKGMLSDLQAIVVNLDRRCDRLEECSSKLSKHVPWLPVQRFRASDGKQDVISESHVTRAWNTGSNVVYQKKRAIRKRWDDLDSYKVQTLQHSHGERGCSMSHIRAWRRCLELAGDSDQPLLVLEDDASPTDNFTEVLGKVGKVLPRDAHVLYLGYSQAAEWRREISPELVESEYVWTTVAYVIWPAGARLLLSKLPVNQPVDNFMAAACANGELKAYCVRPKIILQAEAWNVKSDVGHSDEASSDVQHSDLFYPGLPGDGNGGVVDGVFFGLDSDTSDEEADEVCPMQA